jgi:ribosomal protein L12E/L44/L45/RPP1/RPP2
MATKHIGRLKSNKRKVAVAYRTIPGDHKHALVVSTENLTDADHDVLMQLVDSPAGQDSYELAEAMARTRLSDGSVMLARFHSQGKLTKVPTSEVVMTPTTNTTVELDELNKLIAEQKGVSIEDLALKEDTQPVATAETVPATDTATAPSNEPVAAPTQGEALSDEDLAKSYRSQADRLSKEAAQLRRQAEELVPTKKKAKA